MKRKAKFIIIGIIVLLIGLYFYLMDMETMSGFIENIYLYKFFDRDYPEGLRNNGKLDYEITPDMIEELIENPDDFLMLEYHFTVNNLSSWKTIMDVKLIPTFPGEMKEMVYAYRKQGYEGMVSPILVFPKGRRPDAKQIIIKKQQITNHFLELIKQVTFKAKVKIGITQSEIEFIPIGTRFYMMNTSPDIPVIDQTKKENYDRIPSLKKGEASFFNADNSKNFFFFPVYISDNNKISVPDYYKRMLNHFMSKKEFDFKILKGKDAHPRYMGTKWLPKPSPEVIIIINNSLIDSNIRHWYMSEINECPGNRVFPGIVLESGQFVKKFKNPKETPRINYFESRIRAQGVTIASGFYSPDIEYFKKKNIQVIPEEHTVTTLIGEKIKGMGVDLDCDKHMDIFWYTQLIEETVEIIRIYINIEGSWEWCWEEYIEACL